MNTSDESRPQVLDYLQEKLVINKTFFWSPLPQYKSQYLALRIEPELARHKEHFDVTELSYVSPLHSMKSLEAFFGKDHRLTAKYSDCYVASCFHN